MKKNILNLLGLVFFSSILFTSCLGDTDSYAIVNKDYVLVQYDYDYGGAYAIANVGGIYFNALDSSKYQPGDIYLLSTYRVDPNKTNAYGILLAENVVVDNSISYKIANRKYLNLSIPSVVTDSALTFSKIDIVAYSAYEARLKDNYIIAYTCQQRGGQSIDVEFSYDSQQTSDTARVNVRLIKGPTDDTSVETVTKTVAVNLSSLRDILDAKLGTLAAAKNVSIQFRWYKYNGTKQECEETSTTGPSMYFNASSNN
ncbi:MAG: hypothetical protein ACK5MK_09705 [Dysgonomonas sp.]